MLRRDGQRDLPTADPALLVGGLDLDDMVAARHDDGGRVDASGRDVLLDALGDVVVQTISTSQLEYDEQQRTYFVHCTPFQPFVNDVIRYWDAGVVRSLKLGLVSATTNKVAIMHVSGVKVTKQVMDISTVVSITLELDKESNTDDINSTGIRMKMNVLGDDYEFSDELTAKRVIAKQYDDALAVAQRIKEIEAQKKADAEKASRYKDVLSALAGLSKTDSSSEKLDPNGMIGKFLFRL